MNNFLFINVGEPMWTHDDAAEWHRFITHGSSYNDPDYYVFSSCRIIS